MRRLSITERDRRKPRPFKADSYPHGTNGDGRPPLKQRDTAEAIPSVFD